MTDPNTRAVVVCDSSNPLDGTRLTTLELNYPLIIHPEFMTHRVFSRNAASARAIPTKKIIQQVVEHPFVPTRWPIEQRGMTPAGFREVDDEARALWLSGRDAAVEMATRLMNKGVHKQIATRPLIPYMYIRVLVTATEWDNFFALRIGDNVQYEMQLLAQEMGSALYRSQPIERYLHLPYAPEGNRPDGAADDANWAFYVSAGRCARVSYLTHDGKNDPSRDYELGQRLKKEGHMSPFEHVALVGTPGTYYGNFKSWKQFRKSLPNESVYQKEN